MMSDAISIKTPLIGLFPGSGAQYVGMGKALATQFKEAATVFEKANDLLHFNLSHLCFCGSLLKLNQIDNCLLAIYVSSIAYFEVIKKLLDSPFQFLTGHSLGEYTALTCAGALSFEEGLDLVKNRAKLAIACRDQFRATMTIVKQVDTKCVEEFCRSFQPTDVTIGCYNSQDQITITGKEFAVHRLEQMILDHFSSAKIIPLPASPPFHSPLLKEAATSLATKLETCNWGKWECPVISNVTARPYESKDEAILLLKEQFYKPVQWVSIMHFLSQFESAFLEIGPQTLLKQLSFKSVYAFDHPQDRKILLSAGKIHVYS